MDGDGAISKKDLMVIFESGQVTIKNGDEDGFIEEDYSFSFIKER